MVNTKSTKLPIALWSKASKCYKRNAIVGYLHRSKRTLMNFADEDKHTKTKFVKAD